MGLKIQSNKNLPMGDLFDYLGEFSPDLKNILGCEPGLKSAQFKKKI
jgi:hypothetical protein